MALCLLTSLIGCAATKTIGVPTRDTPPEGLLADCVAARGAIKTNKDILTYVESLKSALKGCNDDKAALREWAKGD